MIPRRTVMKFLLWAALALLPAAAVSFASAAVPFTAATATSTDGKHFNVTWVARDAGKVAVYAVTTPNGSDRSRKVGTAESSGGIEANLPEAPRWFFTLVPERGQALTIAERSLRLATAPNFRDAGGYRAADGRWVRMGLLYRSDQLNLLSDADLGTIRKLDIRLVCDFRTEAERSGGPDRLPDGAAQLIADVNGNDTSSPLVNILATPGGAAKAGPDKMAASMVLVYRQLVSAPNAQKAYKSIFERLSHPENVPGVFHCTAGKDRTGWATAVFLSILGVPRDTIMADYLASNEALVAKNERTMNGMPPDMRAAMEPLFTVRAEYLAASFDEVTQRYRSMADYLRDGLGLDASTIAGLTRLYLTE